MSRVYEDDHLFIEVQNSHIPWLKVFTKKVYKEFSEVPLKVKLQILSKLDTIEREMLSFFNPAKINIASFGNELPHVHFHIMARFEDDGYFPNPIWGEQIGETKDYTADMDRFLESLEPKLEPMVLEEEED